jgi:hypothetical protein
VSQLLPGPGSLTAMRACGMSHAQLSWNDTVGKTFQWSEASTILHPERLQGCFFGGFLVRPWV